MILARQFSSISFSHIYRDANSVAHNLAKLASFHPPARWCDINSRCTLLRFHFGSFFYLCSELDINSL